MLDPTQLLLAFVVIVVTVMLVIVFIQVFFILKELRVTLNKANKILDDTGVISESVSKPVSMLSAMLLGMKGGRSLLKALKSKEE